VNYDAAKRASVLIFLFVSTIAYIGCSSGPEPRGESRPLSEVTYQGIEDAFEAGRYEEVIQEVQLLDPASQPQEGEHTSLDWFFTRSVEGLVDSYHKAVDSNDYYLALSLGRSLAALHILHPEIDIDLLDERELALRKLEEAGDDSPIPFLNRFLFEEIDDLSDAQLEEIAALSVAEANGSVAARIAGELQNRGKTLDSSLGSFINGRKRSPEEQLPAVATVWVNRGMTITGGVGLPDRVIGSGFFIDRRGYLITNYHVIASEVDPSYEGYSRLYVKFSDDSDTRIPARVVGYSKTFDLALLKTEREPKQLLSFSPDKTIHVGEKIFAIGSPGGLENTLTAGIVSSTGRKFLQLGDVFQVDVPINHGNSGGPLLNASGELIGIVFAGIEQFEGINFAIPSEWALLLLEKLYKGGDTPLPSIGFAVRETQEGLSVIYVAPGSPAENVGIRYGDLLTEFDGTKVNKLIQVHPLLINHAPGELAATRWLRDGQERSLLIRMEKRKPTPFLPLAKIDRPEDLFPPLFGMRVELIGGGLFSDRYQVQEVFSGSNADETGFSPLDPFTLQKWQVIDDPGVVVAVLRIKKRKAGFLESGVQMASYLETTNFL
jgi:S1-C subfamily serine protease